MKKLSKIEMKRIMGGYIPKEEGDGGTPCESDSDCGTKVRNCADGTTFTANGKCNLTPGATSKTCKWASC